MLFSYHICECMNSWRFTYEIAPTFTLMETIVINHMISKIGWDSGDGILAPGGTISNLYSVLLARYRFDPRVKTEGVHLHKFVVFTSEHVSLLANLQVLWLRLLNRFFMLVCLRAQLYRILSTEVRREKWLFSVSVSKQLLKNSPFSHIQFCFNSLRQRQGSCVYIYTVHTLINS